MKDIVNKLAENVKVISGGVVGQTQTTLSQGKVELKLLQAENDMKKLYAKLGEKVYQNRLYPQTDPGIEALYNLLFEKEEELIELKKQVEDIRQEQKDTISTVKRKVQKTWNDGEKEEKEPEENDDGEIYMKFCDECQIGNHPEAQYCIACGCSFIEE